MLVEMLAVSLIAIMRLFPETPFARTLHHALVERPMLWLSTLERHQILFLMLVIAMAFAAGEIIAALGSFDVAVGFAWDLSIYFDAVAATIALMLAQHATLAVQHFRTRLAARYRVRSRRERRRRTQAKRTSKANDDDPAPALAYAA